MDLVKDNIISTKDTRFLLLASEKLMFGLVIDFIKKEIEQMNNNLDNKKINNFYLFHLSLSFYLDFE